MTTFEGIHRSPSELTEIRNTGTFGGVFASATGGMYGEHVYIVSSPRHLTDFELNYELEGAWEAALEICDGDESLAEAIMSAGCEVDGDAEAGWEAQRLRGRLAAKLGYTSIEMLDETGSSALCLPGCTIERAE